MLLLLLLATPSWSADSSRPVSELRVRGTLRIEAESVLGRIKTRPGDAYDADKVRRDIQAIYGMGVFDDVLVERDDADRVTFVVLERPALRSWTMDENSVLKKEDVEKDIPLRLLEILKVGEEDAAAQVLREKFAAKGYHLARVEPELTIVEGGNHQADLTFRIDPREEVTVRTIRIPGATPLQEKEIKGDLVLAEESVWNWITDGAKFDPAALARDAEWIRNYYLERGYAQVTVSEPLAQLSLDLLHMEVTIPVVPGPEYSIGEVVVSGDDKVEQKTLLEATKLEKGQLFTMTAVRNAMRNVENIYADEGYAFAEVAPRNRFRPDVGLIDLEFVVRKGERYRIGRIEASGNEKTRDSVVRREMELSEGDLYNRSALSRSERNLKRLGYFESVELSRHRRTGENVLDIDVGVKEANTGTFSVGAGYSSEDRFFGMFNISNRNLFGYGYQVSADSQFSGKRQTYSVSFTNPRIFDSKVSGGFQVFKTNREYSEYKKKSKGFSMHAGTELVKNLTGRISYGWDTSEILDVCTDEDYANGLCDDPASSLVQQQEGTLVTSKIEPSLTYDTRDSYMDPTEGNFTRLGVEWAGWILGGDAAYVKTEFEERYYFPLPFDTVFMARGRAGYIKGLDDKGIPVYELYALGGSTTLRGFDWRSVGPKDDTGEVVGGNKHVLANLEFLFPLIPEAKLKGVLFFDAGNAWGMGGNWFFDDLRTSVGIGIRWLSPMGPLRLEYGYNLAPEPGETHARWEFSIGGFL